jgi:hypothetical protein
VAAVQVALAAAPTGVPDVLPWGHVAVGYLCYSLLTHLRGRTPTGAATIALVVGTQFPDLVDKPLSWSFDLLPAGVLAHSLFFAVPFSVLVLAVARRFSHTDLAGAFLVGYLSHLPADVLPSLVTGDPSYWPLFWPAMARPGVDVSDPIVGPGAGAGLLENAAYYMRDFLPMLFSPVGAAYVLVMAGIFALWLYDGRPGTGIVGRAIGRITGRSSH